MWIPPLNCSYGLQKKSSLSDYDKRRKPVFFFHLRTLKKNNSFCSIMRTFEIILFFHYENRRKLVFPTVRKVKITILTLNIPTV